MTENPPPPSGTPEGDGRTPPPPQNPYGSQPSAPPPPPQNPYASQPPPPADPYAGNPPAAGQEPSGAVPQEPAPTGRNPYGAEAFPVAPSGPAPVAGAQPGNLLPRFLARLIDSLILLIPNAILIIVFDSLLGGLLGGLLYLAYYVYLDSSQGRTFGKQALKLRVLGPTGDKPTIEQSLRRNAWAALSLVSGLVIIGAIAGLAELVAVIAIAVTISNDPLRRGWHDKFGNTSVIREG